MGGPRSWFVATAAVLAFVVAPAAACATTISVTTTTDLASGGSRCALREAIIASNTDAAVGGCPAGSKGANTIEVPPGLYQLAIPPSEGDGETTGDLNITKPVTIEGSGAAATIMGSTDRVFHVESAGVQIMNVAIDDGFTPEHEGGGILVAAHAALTLANSTLSEDVAFTGGGIFVNGEGEAVIENSSITKGDAEDGGGIFNGGVLTVVDTAISFSTVQLYGGGILNDGTLTLSGDEVGPFDRAVGTEGAGGGIFSSGTLTATDTTFMGNTSALGGGLFLRASPMTLTDVAVTGNTAVKNGGGIDAHSALTLRDSTIAEDKAAADGGGIYFEPEKGAQVLDVEGSTIGRGNTAEYGAGGFLKEASASQPAIADVTRSTIAENGNEASVRGGGLLLGEHVEATLHDVTLAENSAGKAKEKERGGNLYVEDNVEENTRLTWENSLVANAKTGGNCAIPVNSTLKGLVKSLGGDEEYGPPTEENNEKCGFLNGNDIYDTEDLKTPSQLGPLENNGGPTETVALGAGSVVSPVGTGFGCEPTDQRGVPRPPPPGCDSGAYQLVNGPLVVSITSGPSGTVTTPDVSFSFTAEEPSTFECKLDGGSLKSCTSPDPVGPLALGPHTFSVRAIDGADLLEAETSRTFTIAASPNGGGSSNGSGGAKVATSSVRPSVSGLTQSALRWREGSALPHISRVGAKPPRGTTFSFTLNEAAALELAFTQTANGRSAGGRCVAQTKHNLSKHACHRTVTVGVLGQAGIAGTDRVRFEGRLSAKKKLKPGRYTLVLSASAGGLSSTPRSVTFTIVS